jgi:hypothetical protein
MDVKRYLNTRIWADTWFENLEVDEKLVWIYLLTNQQTNLIGIYEIGLRRISNETGVEINRLQTVMERFANSLKAFHNGYFVVIPNSLAHQTLANPNMEKSAKNIYDSLPLEIKKLLQSLGIADFESLLKGLPNRLQTVTKPFANRCVIESESESEIESEKEREKERECKGKTENPHGFSEVLNEDIFNHHQNMIVEDFPKSQKPQIQTPATTNLVETTQNETVLWPSFEDFWETYDKKRGDREKVRKKWDKLKQSEKEATMAYIPEYIKAQPEKQFRKDPSTFLNNKSWNDEIITRNNPQSNQQPASTAGSVSRIYQRLVASRGAG